MTIRLCRFLCPLLLSLSLLWTETAQAHDLSTACGAAGAGIPPRSSSAYGAQGFFEAVAGLGERERDKVIRSQLMAGNMPQFLRHVQPVSVYSHLPGGAAVSLTLCVMADYLSLGSDDDFVLVPMGLETAMAVASQLGFTLPTPQMVDLIYSQAAVHLEPQPLPAGAQMRSSAYFRLHDAMVKLQREKSGRSQDTLTAGHKKDLVLSMRLWKHPGQLAIYGWQRLSGEPIQPLSTVHGAHYADYSHGVRLVSTVVLVNGVAQSMDDVLSDKQLAPLLSAEGTMPRQAAWVERSASPADGS